MRELAGKGCLLSISIVVGIFACNELLWSVSLPRWVGLVFGAAVGLGLAWFLLSESKDKS